MRWLGSLGDPYAVFQQSYPQKLWTVSESAELCMPIRRNIHETDEDKEVKEVEEIIVRVALDCPLPTLFDYRCALSHHTASIEMPWIGRLVRVPFRQGQKVGVICEVLTHSTVPAVKLRTIESIFTDCPPLSSSWLALIAFAADYYRRALGEVMLCALPSTLRCLRRWPKLSTLSVPDKIIKARKTSEAATDSIPLIPFPSATSFNIPTLTVEQAQAVQEIGKAQGFTPFLLHGVTGSGKTEVYLQALMALLERTPQAQALILVPEINLTPQFEAIFRKRFSSWSSETIVTLHSGLAEGARARNWWAAHTARARIVLGTRLSVLASLPHLSLLIVDEEHDAAYKQQEGIRYSARDLAIWRAKSLNIPIILGSATPSLETWRHAESGRYTRLTLNQRALPDTTLPTIRLIDMAEYERRGQALVEGLSTPLLEALHTRLSCGEQSLIFLNRRGYAPSLVCHACGWVAGCLHCSVYLVWHKLEQSMQCHHCGERTNVPHACAACGSVDLAPFGQGTQRVEEALAAWLPQARIARIDADSTRKKGSAQALFDAVDAKEIDIMIGTQMITKGHDFKNVTLVGVLNADTALFSHDFRASERLFAQLIQASGRAGRTGGAGRGEVLIQTHYPQHPLYEALIHHDYHGFAANLLSERRQARLPPFTHQAILRAEATTLDAALTFLTKSASLLKTVVEDDAVTCYAPVPMIIAKVKNVHRAHLLVESGSRQALRRALDAWQILLRADKTRVRWFIEVDPIEF